MKHSQVAVDSQSNEKQDSDGDGLRPYCFASDLYSEREAWKYETCFKRVEEWDTAELTSWIRASVARHGTEFPKVVPVVNKLLTIIEEERIDGPLLLAGGPEQLKEKAGVAVRNKADRHRLPHAVAFVFRSVRHATERAGTSSLPYWDRMWTESEAGRAVCEEYGSAGAGGAGASCLRLSLEPRPLSEILFAAVRIEESANVIAADECVEKEVTFAASDCCIFKVVSVALREAPSVVWSNLIYARSDLVAERTETAAELADVPLISRAQRRRLKKRHNKQRSTTCGARWQLIASVDFDRHGSAPPGHWHLNRTTCGDLLPHLRISHGHDGEAEREVWHGAEDGCPLWWHFIPEGMVHKNVPPRLQSLVEEMNRGVE